VEEVEVVEEEETRGIVRSTVSEQSFFAQKIRIIRITQLVIGHVREAIN